MADLAIEIAKGSASLASERARLVDEPIHRDRVVTANRIDPFTVPLDQKTMLLQDVMEYVQRQPEVVRSHASLWARGDKKLFVSTEGSRLEFDLLAVQGEFTATARHDGRFASRTFTTPALAYGVRAHRVGKFYGRGPAYRISGGGKSQSAGCATGHV